jgi:protein involved in polysaccharide export with SLBB domain
MASCAASKNDEKFNAQIAETDAQFNPKSTEYIIQAGDIIDLKFYYYPELNETVTVRPDYKINLSLIDEVDVTSMTPSELDKYLTEKYSSVLKQSDVAVILRSFEGQKIFVGGEVNSPGMFPFSGNLTPLQAIMQAGGIKDTAEMRSVVILRNQKDSEPLFLKVNLEDELKYKDPKRPILLKSYDIIYIPKSNIANLNQFVAQYIKNLIPISLNLGFTWFKEVNPVNE